MRSTIVHSTSQFFFPFNLFTNLFQDYGKKEKIDVKRITPIALGAEIRRRFGEEDKRKDLSEREKVTLKFLNAAISFYPLAFDAGTDFDNVVFIFAQNEREFVIKAGNGDWEFLFQEEDDGRIHGKCCRQGSHWRYAWDQAREVIVPIRRVVQQFLEGQASNFLMLLSPLQRD